MWNYLDELLFHFCPVCRVIGQHQTSHPFSWIATTMTHESFQDYRIHPGLSTSFLEELSETMSNCNFVTFILLTLVYYPYAGFDRCFPYNVTYPFLRQSPWIYYLGWISFVKGFPN